MASVVLRTAGSAAGNALLPGIGGAFFGSLGRSIGGIVDGQLGLGAHVTGPRLDNLAVQDSRYGAGIPVVYGEARVAGNVIWSTDLIETSHDTSYSGGKGGLGGGSTTATTYTYSVHCAVGICAGPIGAISTIWADSNIIYQNGVWTAGTVDSATIYPGTTAQVPDAFMESMLGSGNVPAYRGLAYIVLENLQLANFGNRLPNLTFEIVPVASDNPFWLGAVDASIDQRVTTAQSGGMKPIPLSASGGDVRSVLIGGYQSPGSACVFEVAAYDIGDTVPVQLSRTQSASFGAASPVDTSWAMAPDGRYVAMYLQNSSSSTMYFAIYDSEAEQFGSVTASTLTAGASITKQIAWLDPQHFVIDDTSGTHRGLHVFARAGLNILDLGFFDVWGAGTASTYQNFYTAQFTPFAGGLLNYTWDTTNPLALMLYARPISWQNNALVVGGQYTALNGLALGSGSGQHANWLQTGDGEWTLCVGTVLDFRLVSFEPGLSAATITRPWTVFTPGIGTGSTQCPIFYGDRLIILQCGAYDYNYRLSEVTLDTGGFTRTIDGAVVTSSPGYGAFTAIPVDGARFLTLAVSGFANDIVQVGLGQRRDTGYSLGNILTDILGRAGYAGGDYDVSALAGVSVDGYVLQEPTTARLAIEPLQVFSPFDLIETDDVLKAVLRGATADVTIPPGEWRAASEKKEQPPALETTRAQEIDLPVEVDVDYIDAARNFEANSQRARRIATHAVALQKIALPIVCTASLAKQIAETRLFTLWAERTLVRISISRKYLALTPGDVIDLGNGTLLRVTSVKQAGGLMQVEGFYAYAAAQNSAALADAGASTGANASDIFDSILYLMDLPLLQSSDDQPGVYAAAAGLPGWLGATLWRASDGVNYSNIAALPVLATTGIAVTVPNTVDCSYMDRLSSVEVQLLNGSLSSCSQSDLYNGANAALLGGEIIQFQNAALTGPGLYTLTNLLRGRRGTEFAATSHAVGENFVLLTPSAVDFVPALQTDRGASYEFRALSRGQSIGDAQDVDFTYSLNTIKPFSPANIQGTRASGTGSDLTLIWKRRARLNAEWVDYIDVPLDEDAELYDVEIVNGSTVVRTFSSVTSPTQIYTAAEQSADWGTVPATFTVNVYQLSSRYGRGQISTAAV